jgi:hypothetical protein
MNACRKNPEILALLGELIDGETAGAPISGRKWLRRDLRELSRVLHEMEIALSHVTIRRLLGQQKYSLKTNRQEFSDSAPQRNRQFRYIERVKKLFIQAGHLVISVDAKKKELIGDFKNPGRSWQQEPEVVNVHDFPDEDTMRATPYSIIVRKSKSLTKRCRLSILSNVLSILAGITSSCLTTILF